MRFFHQRVDRRQHRKEEGFTLIELLVVILIIGILSAIAIPAFLNQRQSAVEATVKSDVRNAGTLLGGVKKFTGELAPDTKVSEGNRLVAMRKSDRNNVIVNSQFIDGSSESWGTFRHPSGSQAVSTQTFTDTNDGWRGMNYRRATMDSGSSNSMGHTSRMDLPTMGKTGEKYSFGVAVRQNYDGCRTLHLEYKDGGNSWPGGISSKNVCFTANEWKYVEHTGAMTGDGALWANFSVYGAMSAGQQVDITGAVVTKGEKINADAALDLSGYDYCVQGYSEADPENIWSYSATDGGLQQEAC